MVFAFLVWNRVWLHIYGYRYSVSGPKRGMKNHIFWSEIGSEFWETCGTPPSKILESTFNGFIGLFYENKFMVISGGHIWNSSMHVGRTLITDNTIPEYSTVICILFHAIELNYSWFIMKTVPPATIKKRCTFLLKQNTHTHTHTHTHNSIVCAEELTEQQRTITIHTGSQTHHHHHHHTHIHPSTPPKYIQYWPHVW